MGRRRRAGHRTPLPASGRSATLVRRGGHPVAALIHDSSVAEEDGLVEAVAATAGLALENERLHADLRARLEDLAQVLRSDNGRELIAQSLIEKGSPQQNAFVERFNGTMRDELLHAEEFASVLEARVVINNWLVEYNTLRPHRGLGMMTPAAYAESCNEDLNESDYPHSPWTSPTSPARRRSEHPAGCAHIVVPQKKWTKPRGPVTPKGATDPVAA